MRIRLGIHRIIEVNLPTLLYSHLSWSTALLALKVADTQCFSSWHDIPGVIWRHRATRAGSSLIRPSTQARSGQHGDPPLGTICSIKSIVLLMRSIYVPRSCGVASVRVYYFSCRRKCHDAGCQCRILAIPERAQLCSLVEAQTMTGQPRYIEIHYVSGNMLYIMTGMTRMDGMNEVLFSQAKYVLSTCDLTAQT